MTERRPYRPQTAGAGGAGVHRVFIRELKLDASIGAHAHERNRRQPIVISVDLTVRDHPQPPQGLADVVCYSAVVDSVRRIVNEGHIDLVETLAERVAEACLADPRVDRARVRVEKVAAIAATAAVGVEIERGRQRRAAASRPKHLRPGRPRPKRRPPARPKSRKG